MRGIDTRLKINKATCLAPNLTDRFTADELQRLGEHVWNGYVRDKQSREDWERRMQAGMDLALQIQKQKSFPWPGCSNVAFPLITIATLQFHSQAYPQLVRTPNIVRYRTTAPDQSGEEYARALRVSDHMSYQVLEEDRSWEEQHDRLLINLPIVGCAFKKVFYHGGLGHNVSRLVLAQDLVMDYYAKSIEEAGRKTEIIPVSRNEIYENARSGVFADVLDTEWFRAPARPLSDRETARQDKREGTNPPQTDENTPFTTLEQHCWLDLDDDGYMEPYIVTIEFGSHAVLRIVARWEDDIDVDRDLHGRIIRIRPTEYYEKYSFIPSPDNGVYDLGFGVFLGPLNESVNTLVNQLIDAGTMATTAGGFLGRGAKLRGGQYTFAPLEWKRVDAPGDDLRKNIFPMPVREPSPVLFNLLDLLINYTQRISGTTDTMVGENPGQNTPASTTQTMVRNGMRIYNAIYKRVWRSMRQEFRKLYILNARHLPEQTAYGMGDKNISRKDYLGNPDLIAPEADPNVVSDNEQQTQALFIKNEAMRTNGYDLEAVERNLLRAFKVDGADILYPGPKKVPPLPNPKVQVEQVKQQAHQAKLQFEQQKFIAEMQEEHALNQAKILQLEAQAALFMEQAGGVKTGHEIAAFEAAIGAMKSHNDALTQRIQTMLKMVETANAGRDNVDGMEGTPGDQSSAGGAPAAQGGAQGGMGGGGVY